MVSSTLCHLYKNQKSKIIHKFKYQCKYQYKTIYWNYDIAQRNQYNTISYLKLYNIINGVTGTVVIYMLTVYKSLSVSLYRLSMTASVISFIITQRSRISTLMSPYLNHTSLLLCWSYVTRMFRLVLTKELSLFTNLL